MSTDNRSLLAAFIRQRIELGDRDWSMSPELLLNASREQKNANHAVRPQAMTSLSQQPVNESGDNDLPRSIDSDSPPVSNEAISDRDSLDSLYMAVKDCTRCGLGHARTKFVFGEGNPHSGIMFIGEAPGRDEDEQGRPFVGRAGQLLTKMIDAMKLSRDEVFIGNILKCRPPKNRDPKPDEIGMCEPILLRQIELIKPEFICALGRIAGQTLLRTNSSLTALRGTIHNYHGIKLIVTYHPAALLRNQKWKPLAWEDLKFLRHEYDGLEL